jgi:hypothetical protein
MVVALECDGTSPELRRPQTKFFHCAVTARMQFIRCFSNSSIGAGIELRRSDAQPLCGVRKSLRGHDPLFGAS